MGKEDYPADWEKRRTKVLGRDGYNCQECATDLVTADTQAHVHHIKPISQGGGHSYDNLESLCRECHINKHSHGKPKDPIDIYKCSECGEPRTQSETVRGSFCSKVCVSRHKARKILKAVDHNENMCSSCHRPFGDGMICRNCGNHTPNKDSRNLDIDRLRLVAYTYRITEWGDDWSSHNP